jgi:hypothetical protein
MDQLKLTMELNNLDHFHRFSNSFFLFNKGPFFSGSFGLEEGDLY